MVNEALVALVNSVLGQGVKKSSGNISYICPFHNQVVVSEKLEINFDQSSPKYQKWACWVCESSKGKTIKSLFNKLEFQPQIMEELKLITDDKTVSVNYETPETKQIKLPKEFISILDINKNSLIGRHALAYLKSRGITKEDIIKHNIGYCEKGRYSDMIIIPSYNKEHKINFFTGRSFQPESKKKLNPEGSRNIIPFEFYINWDLPVILCEGPFDALIIKRNAIPLLGKTISNELMKKLITSNVDKIYIALDKDAQKQSLKFCEELLKEGKEVYLVDLDKKDPNSLGFEHFTKLIQNTYPLTFSNLMEKKLQI